MCSAMVGFGIERLVSVDRQTNSFSNLHFCTGSYETLRVGYIEVSPGCGSTTKIFDQRAKSSRHEMRLGN